MKMHGSIHIGIHWAVLLIYLSFFRLDGPVCSQLLWVTERSHETLQFQACADFVLRCCEDFQRVDEEETSQGCERETMAHDLEQEDREVKSVPDDRQRNAAGTVLTILIAFIMF